jgi:hypothetical protein
LKILFHGRNRSGNNVESEFIQNILYQKYDKHVYGLARTSLTILAILGLNFLLKHPTIRHKHIQNRQGTWVFPWKNELLAVTLQFEQLP